MPLSKYEDQIASNRIASKSKSQLRSFLLRVLNGGTIVARHTNPPFIDSLPVQKEDDIETVLVPYFDSVKDLEESKRTARGDHHLASSI